MKQEVVKILKDLVEAAVEDGVTEDGFNLTAEDILALNNQKWIEEIEKYKRNEDEFFPDGLVIMSKLEWQALIKRMETNNDRPRD